MLTVAESRVDSWYASTRDPDYRGGESGKSSKPWWGKKKHRDRSGVTGEQKSKNASERPATEAR